jgi:hypothetical protein
MATPPSKPDLAAIAVVDSNALFTENDVEVVNAEFAGQLAQFKKFDVEFVVPQVVVREILFWKLAFLRRLENDVRRNLSTAARLTDSSLHPVPSFFILSLRLARRWKKWASTNGIRVSAIPFEQINWKKLCSASVHRRPPFSPFEPVSKSEKGFRDALILETLKEELRRADKKGHIRLQRRSPKTSGGEMQKRSRTHYLFISSGVFVLPAARERKLFD